MKTVPALSDFVRIHIVDKEQKVLFVNDQGMNIELSKDNLNFIKSQGEQKKDFTTSLSDGRIFKGYFDFNLWDANIYDANDNLLIRGVLYQSDLQGF